MAIGFGAGGSTNNQTGTGFTFNVGTDQGAAVGNLSLCQVQVQGDKSASMGISGTGWTAIVPPVYDAGADLTVALYYTKTGNASGTVSWTGSANYGYFETFFTGTILNLVANGPVTNNDADTNVECPQGVARTVSGDAVLVIATYRLTSGTAPTASTGFTSISRGAADTNMRWYQEYKLSMSATENIADIDYSAAGNPANSRTYAIVLSETSATPPSSLVPAVHILT